MNIIDLINDYTTATAAAGARLRSELGAYDLLEGWHRGKFPQRGILSDGSGYQFHGSGCTVEGPSVEVDFDFGPGGCTEGFDAWRLWRFGLQFPEKYPDLQQFEVINNLLQKLKDGGVICPAGAGYGSLLFLRRNQGVL